MNEAEKAVVGNLILNEKAQAAILDEVSAEDFTAPELGALFRQLSDLYLQHRRLDAAMLSGLPDLELAMECAETVPSLSGYPAYIARMKEHTLTSRAAAIGMKLAANGVTGEDVQTASQELAALLAGRKEGSSFTAVQAATWFLNAMAKGKPPYFSTGFSTLDKYTGWGPGDFIIIAGRPSAGKTAFSLQIARQMAARGKKVVYYSYETSRERLAMRLYTNVLRADYDTVRHYALDVDKLTDLELSAIDHVAGTEFEIQEASGKSVQWLRVDAQSRGADVVMIDYLGLIPGRGQSAYERATDVSKSLHEFAQQTKICVVALCQLNRAGAGAPKMENLRDSGQIEQDADNIILLDNDKETGEYTVDIAKNKDGMTGPVAFAFDGAHQYFMEVER